MDGCLLDVRACRRDERPQLLLLTIIYSKMIKLLREQPTTVYRIGRAEKLLIEGDLLDGVRRYLPTGQQFLRLLVGRERFYAKAYKDHLDIKRLSWVAKYRDDDGNAAYAVIRFFYTVLIGGENYVFAVPRCEPASPHHYVYPRAQR